MGAVYKARQPALDRLVALKVLPAGGGVGSTERFNREARALARLSHPNIVAVHEFGQVEGLHFFIMEFVDGANLRQLEKTARLSPREALQIIPQICDALQYAHDEGVVHRDIKPENVLIDRKGRVKIADFGLAKIADPDPEATRLTVEGQVMGTPHYMAPEQVERPLAVDHRADIYALGVVFYEMLTGDLPLGKFAPPSRKVQLDVRLDDIVLRALENDPERRYQQASEVKRGVATVVDSPADAGIVGETAAAPAKRQVCWLNIPVAIERDGEREIAFQGAMTAIFVVMGVAAVTHMFVRWAAGREHALSSLVTLAGILTVVFGIRRAMSRTFSTNRRVAVRRFALDALTLVGFVVFVIGSHFAKVNWIDAWRAGRGGAAAQVAQVVPASSTLAVTLTNGTTIELLALAHATAEPNQWWRPDGTPLPNAAFDIQGPAEMLGNDRPRTKFAFKVSGIPWAMETATCETVPGGGISAGGTVWQDGQKVTGGWPLVAAWSYLTNQATLRFGLRFDNWRPVAAFDQGDSRRVQTWAQSGEPRWIANINHVSDNGTDTLVTAVLNNDLKDWRMRVVAIDLDGKEHPFNRGNATPMENATTWTCTFPNLTQDRIKQFQVQVQPVHWIEFRDVPLSPNGVLPVPVASTKPGGDGPTQPSRLVFGPVREISFDELLDLDTGRSGSFPVKPAGQASGNPLAGIGDNIAWMQEKGFDAEARAGGLGLLGVRTVQLEPGDWADLKPADLMERLGRDGSMAAEIGAVTRVPDTFGFQTREGNIGLMQIVGYHGDRPGVTLMAKVIEHGHRPVTDPPPSFDAAAVAAEPELRFLAWQDQWKTRALGAVHRPDGTPVAAGAELDALRYLQPTGFHVRSDDPSGTRASFLHLWFAHPAFDRESLVAVNLTDERGLPLAPGAGGRSASNVRLADERTSGLGWLLVTLSPADGPRLNSINAQLDYVAGSLEKLRPVAPDFSGMLVLEGESQLTAIGSNNRGQAFVTLMVNPGRLGSRKFGVIAVAGDGRELVPSAHARDVTGGNERTTETFEFDLPLAQVKEFKIGTRPVRTARWTGVVLPPLAPQ